MGLMEKEGDVIRLTPQGRLLSNEVFERFISVQTTARFLLKEEQEAGVESVSRRRAMTDLNPQAKQMADESMVRGLDAQARAIWPQEMQFIRRYAIPADARILDAGCGTGEGSSRLAELFPQVTSARSRHY